MVFYMLDFLFARWKIIIFFIIVIILLFSLYPTHSIPDHNNNNDKIGHLLMYLLLTLPISIVKPNYFYLFYLFFILLGGFIEIIQPLFNRHQDFLDFIFNVFGILLGILLGIIVRKKYSRITNFN